jgi:hypothetical protein
MSSKAHRLGQKNYAALFAASLLLPSPALAQAAAEAATVPRDSVPQEERRVTAEDFIATARIIYGPPPELEDCSEESDGDEIVVCREKQDQTRFRVDSTADLDPESRQALDDGLPRAPNVDGPGIFQGKGIASGCWFGGCPPEPAIIIDFDELPEPPPGSDADLIARGLKEAD